MNGAPELNDPQKEAASFLYGVCLVAAAPGSGKTLTMAERIRNLAAKHGERPESILGLTFTRSAAGAMRTRLEQSLGAQARGVALSTIHSFCNTALKREIGRFNLLLGRKQLAFLRAILMEFPNVFQPPDTLLREISLARGNLITPDEFRILHENDPEMRRLARVMERYECEKKKKGLLDFDDLLLETGRILRERPEIRGALRKSCRHILVDEFQDTNPAMMEVIRLLHDESEAKSSLWVCGDDWQAIYGFNGASLGNLLRFRDMYPGSRLLILSRNYRSTPQILEACGNLVRHNRRKLEKTLTAVKPDGPPVRVLETWSEEDEAEVIAAEIESLCERGYRYGDIGVLFRSNSQSRVIEKGLRRHGIPYRGGVRLMTVHRSKGLEFPVVFVAGLTEGVFPVRRGEIEEERRICFVAASRAERELYLSSPHSYLGRPARRSPFVNEMLGNGAGENPEPPAFSNFSPQATAHVHPESGQDAPKGIHRCSRSSRNIRGGFRDCPSLVAVIPQG